MVPIADPGALQQDPIALQQICCIACATILPTPASVLVGGFATQGLLQFSGIALVVQGFAAGLYSGQVNHISVVVQGFAAEGLGLCCWPLQWSSD